MLEGQKEWAWLAALDDCRGLRLELSGVRRASVYELAFVEASLVRGTRAGGVRDMVALGLVQRSWRADRQRVAPWPAPMHFWQVCANLQLGKLQPDIEL